MNSLGWSKILTVPAAVALMSSVFPSTARAQTTPAPAPASAAVQPGPTASLGSLLDAGYDIRTVTSISADEQKLLWPSDAVGSYWLVIVQKGPSIASCVMGGKLINMSANINTSADCHKR